MELSLPLFFFLFFFFFTVFLLFHEKRKTSTNPTSVRPPLPPGSSGWPLIGETLTYFSMLRQGLQYRFIADRVTRYSSPNIFKTSLLGETMAVMCTPEGNKFLFSNENKLVVAWWPKSFQNIFFELDGTKSFTESTRQLRQQLVPTFLKPQHLKNYVHMLDSETKHHMKRYWHGNEVVRVQELSRHHAFSLACRLFLSVEDDGLVSKLERYIIDVGIGMVSLPFNLPGTRYRGALKASRLFREEVYELIRTRQSDTKVSGMDLLSCLMGHRDENGEFLDEIDMGNKVLGFVFAAHETTSVTIVAVVNFLAELPHVYDNVFNEQMEIAKTKGEGELLNWEDMQKMTYSWNVAREVLRLMPPIFGSFREAISDFTYQGFSIPKGWKLHWNVYATHMNPEYFPKPEKFDPSRFEGTGPVPYSYVPFGGGLRMCPGYEFARFEILSFMHNLVTKYKFEKVFPDEKIVNNPNPYPTRGLPIRLLPH